MGAGVVAPDVHGLWCETLGATRLRFGDRAITPQSGLLFALLARLLYTPGLAVARDTLLRELWPTLGEARRRGNLRQALYKLRSMGLQVTLDADMVRLAREQVVRNFAFERTPELFERDVVRGEEPIGALLPGFTAATPAQQEWLEGARERVHGEVRQVLVQALRRRRERADWSGAAVLARWLLPLDPLNEDATLTLAEHAMLSGAKAEALAILDKYLEDLGPGAGDIRLPATQLRRRFTEPAARRRPSLAATDRHFVGREEEMAELTLAMRRARWHDGSAVLLYGPPGIGKTRLATELGKVAQVEGYLQVWIECREPDQHRPLGVFIEALPQLLSSPGALGCMPESLAVLKRLAGEDVERRTQSAEGESARAASSMESRDSGITPSRSVRYALVDLLASVSEERPTLLVVDDSQFLDDDSWAVVADLVERLSSMRVFVLALSPSPFAGPERLQRPISTYTRRKVSPLRDDATTALLERICADFSLTLRADSAAWLLSSCEGSPLALRALLEHWAVEGSSEGVPAGLTALLQRRLSRLSTLSVRVLQTTAILGRLASLARIRAVLEVPNHEVLESLEQLEQSDCISLKFDGRISSHALVSDASIKLLSPIGVAALNLGAASALEREFAERGDVNTLVDSASFLRSSGDYSALAAFLLRHAPRLLDTGRPREVAQVVDTAILHEVDKSRLQTLARRIRVECGDFRRAMEGGDLARLVELPSLGLNDELASDRLSLIESAYHSDSLANAAELGRHAVQIASSESVSFELRLRAADIGLVIAANTCDQNLARECFDGVELDEHSPLSTRSTQRVGLLFHTPFGSTDVAMSLASQLAAASKEGGPSAASVLDLGRAGYVMRMIGAGDEARDAFVAADELARRLGTPRLAEYPRWQLAQLALDLGEINEAIAHTRQLDDLAGPDADSPDRSYLAGHRCLMAIAMKDSEEARRQLDICTKSLPRIPALRATAYCLALEIGVGLLDPSWCPTEDLVEVAIERLRRTGSFCAADLLAANCVHALHRVGRAADARSILSTYLLSQRRERGVPSTFLSRSISILDEN